MLPARFYLGFLSTHVEGKKALLSLKVFYVVYFLP